MGRQDAAQKKLASSRVELRKQPVFSSGISQFALHPATLIVTALIISLSIAAVATVEMISVDPSAQAPSPATSSSFNALSARSRSDFDSPRSDKDSLPIFSLGAVAVSCAAGSFLLCRCFRPRKPDRRMQFSSSSRRTKRTAASQPVGELNNSRTPPTAANPYSQKLPTQNQAQMPPVAATIVPTNEAHPLDWDEPSIADNLDLRQKRPLSHWL